MVPSGSEPFRFLFARSCTLDEVRPCVKDAGVRHSKAKGQRAPVRTPRKDAAPLPDV